MITIDEAREIMGSRLSGVSDSQVLSILESLYAIGEIAISSNFKSEAFSEYNALETDPYDKAESHTLH